MNRYVEIMKAEGWQVWTRNDSITRKPAEYCFVTDGVRIAYVQWSNLGTRVDTVHKANRQTGTGFGISEDITVKAIRDAMQTVAPSWASDADRNSVRKYKDWNEYHNENSFNRQLFQL